MRGNIIIGYIRNFTISVFFLIIVAKYTCV